MLWKPTTWYLISDLEFHSHWHSKRNGLKRNDFDFFRRQEEAFLWFFMRTFDRQLQKLRWKESNWLFLYFNSRRSFINGLLEIIHWFFSVNYLISFDKRSIGRLLSCHRCEISPIKVQKSAVLHLFMANLDYYLNLSIEKWVWNQMEKFNKLTRNIGKAVWSAIISS
jgi:hypothetical protein